MDPLHLCIAMGPLAVYLLLIGAINLSSSPFLTTGARDQSALGLAVMGFVVAGPMELFMPDGAAAAFGPYIWLIMLGVYVLGLTLVVLLMRPRLVIYNMTADQLRPVLSKVASELDDQVRWAGDCLVLPQLGTQLHLEPGAGMRCSQLVSSGPRQRYSGWRQLEISLATALKSSRVGPNFYGLALIGVAAVILLATALMLVGNPAIVQRELYEFLGR